MHVLCACFVAQVAPEFEPVFQGGTITVYVDEDTQSGTLPDRNQIFMQQLYSNIGEFVTNIRAREVINERLVYVFYQWSTNHQPQGWIGPTRDNPNNLPVFDQDVYRINSANGTVTAGSQAQPYIRLSVSAIDFAITCMVEA